MTTRHDRSALDQLLPIERAAELLDLNPGSLRRYLKARHVDGVMIGHLWKLRASDVVRYQKEGIPSLRKEAA